MLKQFVVGLVVCAMGLGAYAADVRFSIGIESDGANVMTLSYGATEVNEGKTLENMLNKKLEQKYLDGFNKGAKFGKVGNLKTAAALTIGDIQVPAGEHACGFNADAEGNFYFVVWNGEEVMKTKVALEKHEASVIPNLTLMVGPGEGEGTNTIMALYGKYYSMIPVTVGEAAAAEGGDGWDEIEVKSFSGKN